MFENNRIIRISSNKIIRKKPKIKKKLNKKQNGGDDIKQRIEKELKINIDLLKTLSDSKKLFLINFTDIWPLTNNPEKETTLIKGFQDLKIKPGKLICVLNFNKTDHVNIQATQHSIEIKGYVPHLDASEFAINYAKITIETPGNKGPLIDFLINESKLYTEETLKELQNNYINRATLLEHQLYSQKTFEQDHWLLLKDDKSMKSHQPFQSMKSSQPFQSMKIGEQKKPTFIEQEVLFGGKFRKIFYYKLLPIIDELCFNVCHNDAVKSNKQFDYVFERNSLLLTNYNDPKLKLLNLNNLKLLTSDDTKETVSKSKEKTKFVENKAKEVIKKFVSDEDDLSKPKFLFLTHNVQNKNGKETNEEPVGISNIFSQYNKMLFENGFVFTKSMVILLQETNWHAIDTTIYGKGDVYYTNCDVANGSLFVHGDDNKIYGYNTYRTCKFVDKNKCEFINVNELLGDTLNKNSETFQKLMECKRLYGKIILNKQTSLSIGNPRPDEKFQTAKRKNTFSYLTYVHAYLSKVIEELIVENGTEIDQKKMKSLELKYKCLFNFLHRLNKNVEEIKIDKLLDCIFFQPQFKMKYMDFDKQKFQGSIMVHDITDWFEEGLTDKKDTNQKSRRVSHVSGNVVHGRLSSSFKTNRLFAISCDERMNFNHKMRRDDSKENKTKQLCTIFSSDFFDPRIPIEQPINFRSEAAAYAESNINVDMKSHVLLIGLGVAGPTKNHVALVIANYNFKEIVINVHLESGGQGNKVDSNEYAIQELNILLNNILGNNIHPFFKNHFNSIENIRIFSDYNLLSNVIADTLKNFKINSKFREFKFQLLLDRIKTHDNIKIKPGTEVETHDINDYDAVKGCIDNVIYITKNKNIQNNIENVIIGKRKLPAEKYNKSVFDTLSDHSPIIIIENNKEYEKMSQNNSRSANIYDLRTPIYKREYVKAKRSQLQK